MIKAWSDAAWEDFEYWMKQDKKTLKRILQILKDIERNGYDVVEQGNLLPICISYCNSEFIEDTLLFYRHIRKLVHIMTLVLMQIFCFLF